MSQKLKTKDSEINPILLWLEKILKFFEWLNGNVYDFSGNYDAIASDDILDIPKCLMK